MYWPQDQYRTIGGLECGYSLEEVTRKTTVVLSQVCLEVGDGRLGDRAEEILCSEGILSLSAPNQLVSIHEKLSQSLDSDWSFCFSFPDPEDQKQI